MEPGAPFEVVKAEVNGSSVRVFKHGPETIAHVFNRARTFGEAEFIVFGERRLSFTDFFAAADALSIYLIESAKVTTGQSVAICMKNTPEWMIAFVAIINAGGVAVLINSRGKGENMCRAITDADSVFVIADDKRLALLKQAGCDLPSLTDDEIKDLPQDEAAFKSVVRSAQDTAVMFFTSGTTGRAKAAALSHLNLVTGTMNTQMAMAAVFSKMAAAYGIDIETLRSQMPQSCSLLVFPLFHTSGCSAVFLTALTNGGKLVMMDRWDADQALALIEAEKITAFGGVPTMHWDLLRSSKFDDHDLSSLMSLSCGGQALPLNLLGEIKERFPRAFIGAGYGMTETSGAIAQANGEAFLSNPKASGQVLPMVDVQITGDDGQALPSGDIGEIWVKGATLMQGYYGRPEETAKSMSGDWFKTGDIGRLDDNGYIYIVDRKTDMVISGGENIYCAEVEQALGQHPSVLQVTTFGVADDRLGERLVASFVVTDDTVTTDALMTYAKETLAAYTLPTDITVQTRSFELNAMGKVEKHKARDAYLAAHENRKNDALS